MTLGRRWSSNSPGSCPRSAERWCFGALANRENWFLDGSQTGSFFTIQLLSGTSQCGVVVVLTGFWAWPAVAVSRIVSQDAVVADLEGARLNT